MQALASDLHWNSNSPQTIAGVVLCGAAVAGVVGAVVLQFSSSDPSGQSAALSQRQDERMQPREPDLHWNSFSSQPIAAVVLSGVVVVGVAGVTVVQFSSSDSSGQSGSSSHLQDQ